MSKGLKDYHIEIVMQRPGLQDARQTFLSERNHSTLETILVDDLKERYDLTLNDAQRRRLSNTLNHYINEVYTKQGNRPLQQLNKEALVASSKDFLQYMERKEATKGKSAVKQVMDNTLFEETAQRFERLNNERHEVKALPPPVPDFRISLSEDGPPAAEIFERAKKQREMEALRLQQAEIGVQQRAQSDFNFRSQQNMQNKNTELVLRNQVVQPSQERDTSLAVLPDRRELLMGAIGSFDGMEGPRYDQGRMLGQANGNPTLSEPLLAIPDRILSQQVLPKEDKTISYREIENNLFIYSADRDWLRNNKENRYNFTVNFDPAANGQSFGPSVASQQKFKNIVRIELVKCIMPGEALNVTVERTRNNSNTNTDFQDNILNLPYVILRIAELETNNYGTDNFLDRSFGVLQFDTQWSSDVAYNARPLYNRGYFGMIPKFLKCQKEYYPTPLSTLQKLTIDIRRPNGDPISLAPDTFDIGGVIAPQIGSGVAGNTFPFTNIISFSTTNLNYNVVVPAINGTAANFFINTTKYFSKFQVCMGDRIQVNGYTYPDAVLNDATYGQCLRAFCAWINRPEGHIVINFAYSVTVDPAQNTTSILDGFNDIGYANFIIIQAPYQDPTSGNVQPMSFGPLINNTVPNIGAILNTFGTSLQSPVRLMNLNRQLNLVFRIVTRDMDSLPQLRPDNNY